MYDFNKIIDRSNIDSVKYDELEKNFGQTNLLPLWVADMDIQTPDFITQPLVDRAKKGIFGYTRRGDSYYQAIIDWLQTRHDFSVTADEIEYSAGVVFSLNILIQLFTQEGDKILIQPPVYYPFFSVVENNSRTLIQNPLKEHGNTFVIDFEDLEEKTADPRCTMMLLCSPHNPAGRVWTKEELQKVGDICIKNNVLVIADEIHFDLVFAPHKHTVFANISDEFAQNCIVCTAPSKTFNIAGLHSSYIISKNLDRMAVYKKALGNLDLNRSNCFSRVVTESVYTNGADWVDELNDFLGSNVAYINEFCEDYLTGITPIDIEGTYLMLLDCRALELSNAELDALFIEKAGLALDSGHWFGKETEGYMRLNIACPRPILEEAMKKLQNALQQ